MDTALHSTTTTTTTTFPKRIRSVSARLFSISSLNDLHHHSDNSNNNNKRSSCQTMSSPSSNQVVEQQLLKSPSKWFPKIRCRSSSSASSTFSLVFSSTTTTTSTMTDPSSFCYTSENYEQHHQSLESLSSELEELYKAAKEEIAYAIESHGSIYYEGDQLTAYAAFELCETKYDTVMQLFGDTANSIKFRFRWETDLSQLRLALNSLPRVNHSIYD